MLLQAFNTGPVLTVLYILKFKGEKWGRAVLHALTYIYCNLFTYLTRRFILASLDLARTLASSAMASVEEEYCCSYSSWISTDLLLLPRSFLKEMIH